jgi:hypothetical protein
LCRFLPWEPVRVRLPAANYGFGLLHYICTAAKGISPLRVTAPCVNEVADSQAPAGGYLNRNRFLYAICNMQALQQELLRGGMRQCHSPTAVTLQVGQG